MLRPLFTIAALAVAATAVIAQTGDPIEQRRALMKAVGAQTAIGTRMANGREPFDAAKAKEVLRVYAEAADKGHAYFPETSKTGGGTTAAPKIWETQADFRARFDSWAAEIKKASDSTNTLDAFKASFGELTKSCASCHQAYRIQA
jgi:cytochrome c556